LINFKNECGYVEEDMVTSTPARELLLFVVASLLQAPFATDLPYQGRKYRAFFFIS
jgi:hypothetical protein